MQRTADRLTITVAEGKYQITLTDDAVVAVQEEAAGQAASAWIALPDPESGVDLLATPLVDLMDMRQQIGRIAEALDVLIECRPLDELRPDDDD